ncbi:MAG: zf-HC2 domain-containing protein, partial [Planctomycetota bacterium]
MEWAHGTLEAGASREVEAHVNGCEACREEA